MILSFHSSLSGASHLPWAEGAKVAAQAGFEAIDIDLWELGDHRPEAVLEVLEHTGLGAGAASLPVEFRLDGERFERDLELLDQRAKLGAAIGVKVMSRSVPSSGEAPREETLSVLRQRLRACMTILQAHGLRLAVEMLGPLHLRQAGPYELITDFAQCADFAASCGPDVGLLVDSWHWHHAGGGDIAAFGDLIFHVHVADSPDLPAQMIEDKQRLLPGQGVIDFPTFWRELEASGYTGLVTPEVHGYSCGGTPIECASNARAAVAAVGGPPFTAAASTPPPPPPPQI